MQFFFDRRKALKDFVKPQRHVAYSIGLRQHRGRQSDTIRNMALRLHEVFQRFSSIEKELDVEARESGKKAIPAAAGR